MKIKKEVFFKIISKILWFYSRFLSCQFYPEASRCFLKSYQVKGEIFGVSVAVLPGWHMNSLRESHDRGLSGKRKL